MRRLKRRTKKAKRRALRLAAGFMGFWIGVCLTLLGATLAWPVKNPPVRLGNRSYATPAEFQKSDLGGEFGTQYSSITLSGFYDPSDKEGAIKGHFEESADGRSLLWIPE